MSNNDNHGSPTPPNTPAAPTSNGGGGGNDGFCRWYINRWGRLMVASDYGYEAWHFRSKTKPKNKS